MRALARTLVLSGLGMTICDGSYPASQGEHLISHYIDMFAPPSAPHFHGEQVAVATLTMARIQERMLAGPRRRLAPRAESRSVAELQRRFGAEIGESCWREFASEALSRADAAIGSPHLRACRWDEIARQCRRAWRCPRSGFATSCGARAARPRPARSASTHAFYARAVRDARFLRDRYTFLDLADDAGHRRVLA